MSVKGGIMVPHPPLIIPEVGRGREKEIQTTIDAYHSAARKLASWQPDTVMVLSPHSVMYMDYFHISPGTVAEGDFGQFGAPQVKIKVSYDTELVELLSREAQDRKIPAGTLGERDPQLDHGTMIPLWFLNHYYTDYKVVRIGLSGQTFSSHYILGQCIQKTAGLCGRKIAVIGSGDLSHKLKAEGPYGFQKEGPEYDQRIMDVMGRGDFGQLFDFTEEFCEKAAECGHRSFVVMAGALDGLEVKAEELSHQGTFGVGYGVCTFEAKGIAPQREFLRKYEKKIKKQAKEKRNKEDAYVGLARKTIETYVRTGEMISLPTDLPEEMYHRKAGVFVSLKEEGKLRGCIGTISPVRECIGEEILENAVSAATRDPRFPPVQPEELERLVYSVDVLSEAEEISSEQELDVKRYGVIVSRGYKRGLLLPNLEGVDTVRQQIDIAKRKAGIPEEAEDIRLERFEVVRHF
ncbi:MAG TPA: AmmeMemoRadiSam system protein A [Candidatus Blautia stercorigallinarum]|uniref:AmmeMemoRadiSam system protein A n=1 Tax=Candidatus Blautia stercorigallinarum TaxID=2838501 RepID=A0A9D1PG66_9FIRM|nr:AmmeMemoRadiSam system protein A [Candidatus Blautia stercorigallinarum]